MRTFHRLHDISIVPGKSTYRAILTRGISASYGGALGSARPGERTSNLAQRVPPTREDAALRPICTLRAMAGSRDEATSADFAPRATGS